MIAILTQNKALVNINNFETISIEDYEDDIKTIVVDSKYILGQYKLPQALEIIEWIANTIGTYQEESNLVFHMPSMRENNNED